MINMDNEVYLDDFENWVFAHFVFEDYYAYYEKKKKKKHRWIKLTAKI